MTALDVSPLLVASEKTRRPARWPKARIGDVCRIVAPIVDPTLQEYRDLPHVNGERIESGSGRLLPLRSVAEDGMTSQKYLFGPGDVLYSKLRPYLRKVAHVTFQGLCSADMYPLRVLPDALDPGFLTLVLLSEDFTAFAVNASSRSRMPKLNREQLLGWQLALPPLDEQRRIVSRLKKQLEAVQSARASAQAQLEAARALPAAYLRAAFDNDEARGWRLLRLGDVCEIQLGKMLSPVSRQGVRPRPYLRNANVQWGRVDIGDVAFMDFTLAEEAKFALQAGDVVVCEGGEPGRAAVWDGRITPCCYQKALHRLRPVNAAVDPAFVVYRLWRGAHSGEFTASNAKTTIAHLPAVRLAELPIRIPPLAEQRALVATLDSQLAAAGRSCEAAEAQLAELDALPAALLRQAFVGAL